MAAGTPLQQPALRLVPARQPERRHIGRWIGWIAGLLALVAASLVWRAHINSKIVYETVPIQLGSVQAIVTATGTLNPVVNVQVGSQVSGNIKALYADFNTKVKKGQLVALIDPEMFQAQVDQADSAAASAQSAAVTAHAQVEKAQADLATATANKENLVAVAAKDRASFINAEAQWHRSDELFQQQVVSAVDHESAKATYDAAQAQLTADQSQINAADHNVQSAQAQVEVAQTQLKTAQAQQRQAKATLAQAKINLAHTRIVAPVSGTVIARHFDMGQTVAASFQAPDIFDIAQDLTQMQVDTNVDESDIGAVRIGQPAMFTVDAYPGTTFHGSVKDVRKAPISAQNVVTYDVVIDVSNPDFKLFPGMTANVTIVTASQDNVLKVANSALRFHPTAELASKKHLSPAPAGTQQLYILANSKITAVPVQCGISDGKFTIVSGADLKPADQVIVRASSPQSGAVGTPGGSAAPRVPRM